jgi:putative FmdB family regulatory protein
MPIYEFACPVHGRFERLQPLHAARTMRCPECAAAGEERDCDRIPSSHAVGGAAMKRYGASIDHRMKVNEAAVKERRAHQHRVKSMKT